MSTQHPTAKEVCMKVIGARIQTQKQLDYYDEKIGKLKNTFKGLKSKAMSLFEHYNIKQPIVYLPNFHIKNGATQDSRIVIAVTSAYSYPTIQNDHIIKAVNELTIDNVLFIYSKLQKKELNALVKKQRETAAIDENGKRKRRAASDRIDISSVQVSPSNVLKEAVGTKITTLIRKSKPTLKVKDEDCIPKKCLMIENAPHDIQSICTQLVETKKDKQKYEESKEADRALLEKYEKKYESCISSMNPLAFEEKVLNKTVKIIVDTKTTNVKLTSTVVKNQLKQIAHTVPGFDDRHPFTPTMAKEWCSNKAFKENLIERLIYSIQDWKTKSGTIEEKRLHHKMMK